MTGLIIEADGGSRGNPGPAAGGAVVCDSTGAVLAELGLYLGVATNNVAEYRGVFAGAQWAREHYPDAVIEFRLDSKLVVEQMMGRWKIKNPDLRVIATEIQHLLNETKHRFVWVPRAQNSRADALVNECLDSGTSFVRTH